MISGCFFVVPFGIVYLILIEIYKNVGGMWKLYNESQEKMNSSIIEYVQGMSVIKAFTQTAGSFSKFKDSAKEYMGYEMKWGKRCWPYWSAFLVLISAQILFILPIGAWLYIAGTLAIPTFILFLLLGLGFTGPMIKLLLFYSMFGMISEGEKRIQSIMKKRSLPETEDETFLETFDIEFRDVDFSYEDVKVLKGVSFKAPHFRRCKYKGNKNAYPHELCILRFSGCYSIRRYNKRKYSNG